MPESAELVQVVYAALKQEARRLLQDRPTDPLQATELVHEAWARLQKHPFKSPQHYKAVASLAMVHVLTDHARARNSAKRKGEHVTLSAAGSNDLDLDLVSLYQALTQLQELDERAYRVVTLLYLGGMSIEEVSEWIGVSTRTVQMEWRMARAWLLDQLKGPE